jgi:hypothetical protein
MCTKYTDRILLLKWSQGQISTVSKNRNLEEVAELAYLILLDPAEYSSEYISTATG